MYRCAPKNAPHPEKFRVPVRGAPRCGAERVRGRSHTDEHGRGTETPGPRGPLRRGADRGAAVRRRRRPARPAVLRLAGADGGARSRATGAGGEHVLRRSIVMLAAAGAVAAPAPAAGSDAVYA